MARVWTCQRVTRGVKCGGKNWARSRTCADCGKPRPKRKKPAHMVALEFSYEHFVALNGGERCAICKRAPGSRRLDRDHDHHTHKPRGLLCARCNLALPNWITVDWLLAAATYLKERS